MQLHLDWMGDQASWPAYMVACVVKDRRRLLLEGSGCRMWYLGERVIGQYSADPRTVVPQLPPQNVYYTHQLRELYVVRWIEGRDASLFTAADASYQAFLTDSCLPALPMPSQRALSVSIC